MKLSSTTDISIYPYAIVSNSKLQFFLSIRLREQLYKAAFMVQVLFTVSSHSAAASESFVIPPPT